MSSEGCNPLLLIFLTRSREQHLSQDSTILSKDDLESMRFLLGLCTHLNDYKIAERLKVLRLQLGVLLHLLCLEVEHTSVGEHNESVLPRSNEGVSVLREGSTLPDHGEVVGGHSVSEGTVSVDDLSLQSLVTHEDSLLIQSDRSIHGVCKHVHLTHLVIVDNRMLVDFFETLELFLGSSGSHDHFHFFLHLFTHLFLKSGLHDSLAGQISCASTSALTVLRILELLLKLAGGHLFSCEESHSIVVLCADSLKFFLKFSYLSFTGFQRGDSIHMVVLSLIFSSIFSLTG